MVFAVSGCGLVAQSVLGWSEQTTGRRISTTHRVDVLASTDRAEIVRREKDGSERVLGLAPLTDSVTYEVEETVESPKILGLAVGAIVEIGLGALALTLGRGTERCFSPGDCYPVEETNTPYMVLGGTALYLGAQDAVVAAVHGLSGDDVRREPAAPTELAYLARKDGYAQAMVSATIPDDTRIELALHPLPRPDLLAASAEPPSLPIVVPPTPADGTPKPSKEAEDWIVAVMDVQYDGANGEAEPITTDLVHNLGEQLRVFVTQIGYRTIDRSSQQRALHEQILALQEESYRSCFDESCQIELGKALAASHIMRSRITRFGSRCVLNGELVDLTSQVTVAAASSEGDCRDEGFLRMSEEVAKKLLR